MQTPHFAPVNGRVALRDGGVELLTPGQMAEADRLTIDRGISEIDLMGAAGRAVAEHIRRTYPRMPVTILCGPGNNGGDGFVVAHLLRQRGWPVRVVQVGPSNKYGSAAQQFRDLVSDIEDDATSALAGASLIVDALFGAGLDRDLTGAFEKIVCQTNEMKVPVVAVDMPTGICGETGCIRGIAIKATSTVSFFRLKPGHFLFPGRVHCGDIELAQIGIDASVLSELGSVARINAVDVPLAMSSARDAHKFSKGHCLVVAGPAGKTGAARMSARAALRAGAGLVSLLSDDMNAAELAAHSIAEMVLQSELDRALEDERINAVIVGPGNGVGQQTHHNVLTALASGRRVVLDADALSSFAADPDELFARIKDNATLRVVMTPHAGEFSRLFPDLDLQGDKIAAALSAAKRSGAVIVAKGPDSVIASPTGEVVVNANAPHWLATAGSGDILAGIVAGLLAQGLEVFDAARIGVYVHGLAAQKFGKVGLIATDLAHFLPNVLSELVSSFGVPLNE